MQKRVFPYAGLAALKIVSKSMPDSLGGKALRREFSRKLVAMRGLPMKMAQILSMSKDEAVAALQKESLTQIVGVPRHEVMTRLATLNRDLLDEIIEFSDPGIVASLGQVHRVMLRDGRCCALKIKHAGIGPAMDLDTGLMGFMLSVFGQFKEGFSIDEYQKLLTQELRWELDYPYEVKRQGDIHKVFKSCPHIVIPRPYPTQSGDEHVLMDWEASESIEKFAATASHQEQRAAARALLEFHFKSIFNLGMVHADPNPGNFGIRRNASGIQLVVYDFGSLVPLDENLRVGFLRVVDAARQGNDVYPHLLEMGFLPEPLSAIRSKLNSLCQILLEPFLKKEDFLLANWNRSQKVKTLLGPERWNLMIAAPTSLFFFMRAMQGIFHYAEMLGGRINAYDQISNFLEKINGDVHSNKPMELNSNYAPSSAATKLHVVVSKNGVTVISITLPADALDRLDTIMDQELFQSLIASGIEVMKVAEKSKATGYAPGVLFTWEQGEKKVKIFLA